MLDHDRSLEAGRALLLKRIRRADAMRIERSNKVDALRAKMAKAESELDGATIAVATMIKHCSVFESRSLANAIHSCLPRELRDIIYRMFWEEELKKFDHHTNERPWRAHDMAHERPRDDCDCSYETRHPSLRGQAFEPYDAHLTDPEHVGTYAAREAAEAFYRTAPAYIETLNTDQFEKYLTRDHFGAGLVPRDYLPSMTFFLNSCMREPRNETCHPKLAERDLEVAALNAMIGPNQQKLPPITFLLTNMSIFTATRTLDRAESLYHQLESYGADITIVYQSGKPDGSWAVPPLDLRGVMEVPESERMDFFMNAATEQYGLKVMLNLITAQER